jgi:hypothetical protein
MNSSSMKSLRQKRKLEIEKSLLRAERSREHQNADTRSIHEVFEDKRIRSLVESSVLLSMLASNGEYPQVIRVELPKRDGGHSLEYHLYVKRNETDARSEIFPTQATWDVAPFNVVRAVELLVRSNVPSLKNGHQVWMVGEGKRRAAVDRRVLLPYLKGRNVDLSSASLVADVSFETGKGTGNGWSFHGGNPLGVFTKIAFSFEDIKTVIVLEDVIVDELKAKGLLVPVK